MARPQKPDALTAAEHQRLRVAKHALKLLRVRPEVVVALDAARRRTGQTISAVLVQALGLLTAELDAADRRIATPPVAPIEPGKPKPRRRSKQPSDPTSPSLFSLD